MGSQVFESFASSLRKDLGTPDGLTEASVAKSLNEVYQNVISALSKYGQILNYQDAKLMLASEFINIDRNAQEATLLIRLNQDGQDISMPVRLSFEGIQASSGYLSTASSEGKGWWAVTEQDDFIERIGFAILHALGIKL